MPVILHASNMHFGVTRLHETSVPCSVPAPLRKRKDPTRSKQSVSPVPAKKPEAELPDLPPMPAGMHC